MGYITSRLGLQARSRRNARNASRTLSLRRSVDASHAKVLDRRASRTQARPMPVVTDHAAPQAKHR